MAQAEKYDAIVVGAGILGLACTNMLVQQTGMRVANISGNVSDQATLKNQNWLQSGAALLYDPVDDVPRRAVDSFVDTKIAMGLPVGKRRFDQESSILAIPNDKIKRLVGLANYAEETYPKYFAGAEQNCPFVEEVHDFNYLEEKLGNYHFPSANHFNVHDDSFRLTLLVNQLINGIDDVAGFDRVFKFAPEHLKLHKNGTDYWLSDGTGGNYVSSKVLLCTGRGTMSILEGLELADWEQNLLQKEGFEIMRSPVLALENRAELRSGLFINAMRDFAIMRHHTLQDGSPFQYATCHQDFHSDPDIEFSISDDKVERLKKRIKRAGVHTDDDFRGGLFCNRLEKKVSDPLPRCVDHTVSPFVFSFESCEGLVLGLPGKATFALNLAAEMLMEIGIHEPPDLVLGGYDASRLHVTHQVNEEPLRLSK